MVTYRGGCLVRGYRSPFRVNARGIRRVSCWGIRCLTLLVMGAVFSSLAFALKAEDIEVKGLFKNAAIVQINGQQRILKVGKTSPEGVTLVSATSKQAEVEVNGKHFVLSLSKKIARSYTNTTKASVSIPSGQHGHFFTRGKINNQTVQFLVDTGASTIALNSIAAVKLGIDYKRSPRYVNITTASGVVRGYRVMLREVSVGTITLNNVTAVVTEGEYPQEILLGNSFLSKLDMKVESGVLVLQAKY